VSYFFNEAARDEHLSAIASNFHHPFSDIEVWVVAAHRRRPGYWTERL
jgi:hypothetical protein